MPTSKLTTSKKPASRRPLRVLQAPTLRKTSWLVHGFSTRPGGTTTCYGGKTLNLGFTAHDDRTRVEKNRRLLLLALGAGRPGKAWPVVALKQVHSDLIYVVRKPSTRPLAGDGLVTNLPGVALAVQTADCFPILLADKKNKAVGAFHAGWRGTVARIAEKGLGVMRREYGTLPEDVYAAIGPGIQKCCYEVGDELKGRFEAQFPYGSQLFHEVFSSDPVREKYPLLFMNMRAPGHGHVGPKLHLDLMEANRRQLLAAGVPASHISVVRECTSCNPKKFFSHRAEKGVTGRMMAVVGIRPALKK